MSGVDGLASTLLASAATTQPIVLLHGFTGDSTLWESFAAALSAACAGSSVPRDVWSVDLMGHGRSPVPADQASYRLEAQATAVRAALSERGVGTAVWIGYSMGGRLALTAAARHQDDIAALVLVGASPGIAQRRRREQRMSADHALADAIERDGVAAFVAGWMSHPLFASQRRLGSAHLDRMRAQRLRNSPVGLAMSLRAAGAGAMRPLWSSLARLRMPCLLVAGAEDPKYVRLAGRMALRLPSARTATIEGAGHAVALEAPEQLAAVVAGFLTAASGTSITGESGRARVR